MTRHHSLLVGLTLAAATITLPLPGRGDPPTGAILPTAPTLPALAQKASLAANFGRLPLAFESNQGQTDSKVRFLTHSGDSTLFLTPSEAVFSMPVSSSPPSQTRSTARKDRTSCRAGEPRTQTAVRMQMIGSNPKATVLQQQPMPGQVNYLLGKDPRRWHTGVPTFRRVGFQGVYPGVDVVYYGNQRNLEYDFVVAPHADPEQIQLRFAGAQGVRIDKAGDLLVRTHGRELRWQKPAVYQQSTTGKHPVAARFRLKHLPSGEKSIRFVLGRYDRDRTLIIDPVLLYSTFLGGSGGSGSSAESTTGIAIDTGGNAYITGYTFSSDFPTTAGAFQPTKNLGTNLPTAFVTKLNPTGTALIYSTYLGGTDSFGSRASGIAIDSSGNAYLAGNSSSTDFPTTTGAFQRAKAGADDGFVTKLDPTGTALVYSTLLGGSGSDLAKGIAIDSGGNAYVTGSAKSTDFPLTAGAFQTTKKGATNDANTFVTKLNPSGAALVYSTYLGGHGDDQALGIAIDGAGNAYVTGYAFSTDFPTTPGAFQTVNHTTASSVNAFVTKLNATGTALVYSTYLGGTYGDNTSSIAVDSSGNAFVTGSAYSTDFPTTPGAFQRTKMGTANSPNAFVTKLNAAGTALVYSTYLGGNEGNDLVAGNGSGALSIALDQSGNACIAGYAHSTNFPTTLGAFQRVNNSGTGAANAFVARLNSTGRALLYSTYIGGSYQGDGGDGAQGIALDTNGNAYVTGGADAIDFPITPGAFQPVKKSAQGKTSAFVTRLSIIPVFPDFNSDGFTDLLIQNATTGVIASWFMHGSSWLGGAYFSLTPPAEYALVGAGDFSGNGATTLVLQSRTTNQIAFWYTSGTNHATVPGGNFVNTTPGTGWKVVGVGDFNGDGKSDLVFQNQTTNQVAIWFMNGYLYQGGVLMPFTPPTGWTVAGAGDFNADGLTDLVFQNQTTGQIALWYMNGSTYADGKVLTTVPGAGYKIVGVGDYNSDGASDLLFQSQTTNQAAVWYLQNGAYVGGAGLTLTPPAGWKIVGPR